MQSMSAVVTSCTKSPNLGSTFISENNLKVIEIITKQFENKKKAYMKLSSLSTVGSILVVSENLKKV